MKSISEIPLQCIQKLGFTSTGKLSNFLGITGLVIQILALIGMVNFCIQNRNNLLVFLEGMGFVFSNLENTSRWFTILHTSNLFKLYDSVKSLYQECNLEEKKELDEANFSLEKIIKSITALNFSSAYGFVIFPLASSLVNVYIMETESSVVVDIPYASHLPFVPFDNKVVFFGWFTILMMHAFFFVLMQIIVISLLALISINIGEHLKLLQNKFLLGDFRSGGHLKIRNAMIKHKKIIKLKNDLNDAFKVCIFTQSLCGSMHLCVIAYMMVVTKDLLNILILAPYCFTILSELFVVCYSGQIVMYEVGALYLVWIL